MKKKKLFDYLRNLKFNCPKCGTTMQEWTNNGLFLEKNVFGLIPYFCPRCKKETKDFIIYDVTTYSTEKKHLLIFWLIVLIFILVVWVFK
jgi:hypothetical protein